jgi:Fe-S oxidoreductase
MQDIRFSPFKKLFTSKAGVDFGILGNEERCCGGPVLELGEKGLF